MKKVTKIILEDQYGQTPVDVIDYGNDQMTVHANYKHNGYYSKVSLDGNSNMIIEWEHAQGKGRISIPHGGCFDIVQAIKIFEAIGRKLTEKTTIYKEIEP